MNPNSCCAHSHSPPPRLAVSALNVLLAVAALASLGGCAGLTAAPYTDERLGLAVRQTLAQQVLRPDAGRAADAAPPPFDGVSAVHTIVRHREGFKSPPAAYPVIGITGASTQP